MSHQELYLALHRKRYHEVYECVEISLETSFVHAIGILSAQDVETVTYNVIALGVLQEDSPEVRCALEAAVWRFGFVEIPDRYDWPDLIAAFKHEIELRSEGVAPGFIPMMCNSYPCHRRLTMDMLVDECIERIKKGTTSAEIR